MNIPPELERPGYRVATVRADKLDSDTVYVIDDETKRVVWLYIHDREIANARYPSKLYEHAVDVLIDNLKMGLEGGRRFETVEELEEFMRNEGS